VDGIRRQGCYIAILQIVSGSAMLFVYSCAVSTLAILFTLFMAIFDTDTFVVR